MNPSDPHGAGQARCEAVLYWRQPARFQRICPLLVQQKGEWRCSGGRKGARPFWERAAAHWLGLFAACGATLVLGAQLLLWTSGVRGITPLDIILPSRWERVQTARAETFRHLALRSLEHGDYAQVLLALATAEETAPGTNLDTSLITLRLTEQREQYVITDRLYARLIQAYPRNRLLVSVTYRDALLISGRWPTLAGLCLEELDPATPEAGPWLRTLALAADMAPSPQGLIETHRKQLDSLPPAWRSIALRLLGDRHAAIDYPPERLELFATVAIEHATRTGDTILAAEAFGMLASTPDTFRDLRLQNRYRLRFGTSAKDPYALRLTLIDFAPDTAALQQLIASALRAGDADWLEAIAKKLPADPAPDCAGDLWLASTLIGVPDLRAKAETWLRASGKIGASYFDLVRDKKEGAAVWSDWITVVPCSREMLFTLAELRPGTN